MEQFRRHPFIDWTRTEIGLQYLSGSCFSLNSRTLFAFLIHRTVKEGFVDTKGLELHAQLYDHIRRAALLSKLFEENSVQARLHTSCMENANFGVAYVDKHLNIVEMNSKAEALLNSALNLSLDEHRQLTSTRHTQPDMSAFLESLYLLAQGNSNSAATTKLWLKEERKPALLHALPVSVNIRDFPFYGTPVVAIYFLGSEKSCNFSGIARICNQIGLTHREAEVAMLLYSGWQPKAIGCELGVAESTVRVFIRQIHKKLGIKRQSELVRILAELNSL